MPFLFRWVLQVGAHPTRGAHALRAGKILKDKNEFSNSNYSLSLHECICLLLFTFICCLLYCTADLQGPHRELHQLGPQPGRTYRSGKGSASGNSLEQARNFRGSRRRSRQLVSFDPGDGEHRDLAAGQQQPTCCARHSSAGLYLVRARGLENSSTGT